MDKFKPEKNNINELVPQEILNLYKIEGYASVAYEKYLSSKKLFESKVVNFSQNEESQNSLLKTKHEILNQDQSKITSSLIEALENNDIEIQRIGASLVQEAPESQRKSLGELVFKKIFEGLNSQNIQIQRIAVNMIQFAPEDKKTELKEVVFKRITEGLNSNDVNIQRVMAKKIKVAPEKTQDDLREIVYQKIIQALDQKDVKIQKLAATMVQYAPQNKQEELKDIVRIKFELAIQEKKDNQIAESPLYIENDKGTTSIFSRDLFSKTGSQTTLLLGKEFKNNLIIRHIEIAPFLAWKKAYESYHSWIKSGFDYIPIEPIYSFSIDNQNKLANVTSGVLDLNLEDWYAFSGDSLREHLDEEKNKIINTLIELGINHGHPNNANFCLRFYRDINGNVDISRVPRIYLIDFDKATES